jgi:Ca2+-dependent lipid-binding protein
LLSVTIHQAEEVEGKHHTNPFVEVHFRGEKRKTSVIKKNRDPRWDTEFTWDLADSPANDKLHIEVHSKGSSMNMVHRQESLGYVDIALNDVVKNKRINETYSLTDSGRGKLQVELNWRTV